MAIPAILAGLGSKVGMNVVGKVMENTLPKAVDFLKSSATAPMDMFENLMKSFGGQTSKTSPASQFALPQPSGRQGASESGGLAATLKKFTEKLTNVLNILKSVSNIVDQLQQVLGKKSPTGTSQPGMLSQQPMSGQGMIQQPGGQLPGGTGAAAGTPGFGGAPGNMGSMPGTGGASGAGGPLNDQMGMLNYMQQCQKSAQMFELAVKVSEMQHQAAMSAIRGIKY